MITSLEISRANLIQSLLDEGAGNNLEAMPFALGCLLSTSVSLMANTIAVDHQARRTEALELILAPDAGLHFGHRV